MRVPKSIKLTLIIIIGLFGVSYGSYFLNIYLKIKNRPNVILITLDALRPDHLGCYGYKRNTSPNIDRLAEEGVKFTQAIAQSNWTHPSNCSFFTSTYPYMHLITSKSSYLNRIIPNLSEILKDKDYITSLITDHPLFLDRIHGLKDSFNTYIPVDENDPQTLLNLTIKWLKENQNKRFFLWFYSIGPHAGYTPSLPYSEEFYNDGLVKVKHIPIAINDGEEIFGVIPKHVAENNITDISYYISKYDGKIRIHDDVVSLLLKKLKGLNLYNNTLIILTADHGESLGEHNFWFRHGYTLYDITLKVPLIIRYPKIIPKNKVVDSQVRLIDVMPTIMDILKIKDKKYYKYIEGKSLLPIILDKNKFPEKYAFSDNGWIYSIRSESWKLIYINREVLKDCPWGKYYSNDYELYNLKNDPLETTNLVKTEKEIFLTLKKKLDEYIERAKFYQKKLSLEMAKEPEKLDEETKQKLRSLGYVQ